MKGPHIVLVVFDTMRCDRFSAYGCTKGLTPNIDALSEHSVVYNNAYAAAPWTLPSYGSIYTGLYPSQHGVGRSRPFVNKEIKTLPEFLKESDYFTACVSTNAWISDTTGYNRGYDLFLKTWQLIQEGSDIISNRLITLLNKDKYVFDALKQVLSSNTPFKTLLNSFYISMFYKKYDYGAAKANSLTKKILKFWGPTGKRLFLNVNYLETHLKYTPPPGFRKKTFFDGFTFKKAMQVNQDPWAYATKAISMGDYDFKALNMLYDAEVLYSDYRFGFLVKLLKETGLYDNSIIIITADHGENIGDHGLMDHQYCLYNSLIKVPLIIKFPRDWATSGTTDKLVQNHDILWTIAKVVGITEKVKTGRDIEDYSLLINDLMSRSRMYTFSEYLEPQPSIKKLMSKYNVSDVGHLSHKLRSVITDKYKLILFDNNTSELYDLSNDPLELKDISSLNPGKASELKGIIETKFGIMNNSSDDAGVPGEIESQSISKMLSDLGYL